jgi:hypothetical protein
MDPHGNESCTSILPRNRKPLCMPLPLAQDFNPKYSNISQQLAQKAPRDTVKKRVEDIVPSHYHEYLSIFDSKKSEQFPPSQVWVLQA